MAAERGLPEDAAPQRRGAALFELALLAAAFLAGCSVLRDFDIWWHLRTGELIALRRELPHDDWFGFRTPTPEWIDSQWGFQLLASALHAAGGLPALVLGKAAIGAAALGVALRARRRGWPLEWVIAAWIPALLALSGRLLMRPELLTLLFLAAFLCVLFHAPRRPAWLWTLPLLQLLWVNSHGLFVFGPVVVGLCLADRLAAPTQGRVAPLAAAWVGVCAVCLLNPYGLRGALLPLELFGWLGGEQPLYGVLEMQGVGETIGRMGWQAALADSLLWPAFATFVLAAASFGAARRASAGIFFRLLLFAGFAWLGWRALRNLPLFALVAGFVTAWNLGEARESLARRFAPSPRRALAGRAALALALALVTLRSVADPDFVAARDGLRWEAEDWFAHDACRLVARVDMPRRIFAANLGQASVCLFHAAPERRLFYDARFIRPRDSFPAYRAILTAMARGDASWQAQVLGPAASGEELSVVLDNRLTLLEQGAPRSVVLGLLTDTRWRPVHSDAVATVFLPVRTAAALGLPAVDPRPWLREAPR